MSCVSVGAQSARCILYCQKINYLIIFLPFCFIEPFETSAPFTASRSKHSNRSLITNSYRDWVICELRVASCELRVASCELRVASCELRVASCELRVASCELRVASCELRVASCELRVASCELRVAVASCSCELPKLENENF